MLYARLKRLYQIFEKGFGRTTHLTSIDIRNGELTRDALELVKEYDGKDQKL